MTIYLQINFFDFLLFLLVHVRKSTDILLMIIFSLLQAGYKLLDLSLHIIYFVIKLWFFIIILFILR